RFSRQAQGEETVARLFERPASATHAASPKDEAGVIPFLGENPRAATSDARQSEPEFNVKIGERPRVREDIERRFTDAAQEARFNKNTINALGLEFIVPIQSKLRQSADPVIPQSAY